MIAYSVELLAWTEHSKDRIPMVERFSMPVQTVPEVHQSPVQWVLGLSLGKEAKVYC